MKTFLLGAGAQKSGTTFLSDYLRSQEGTRFGRIKEYHVLDYSFTSLHRGAKLLNAINPFLPPRFRKTQSRRDKRVAEMRASPEKYYDFFAGLLDRPNAWLTGDITPAYSALSANHLAEVRDAFAKRGIQTRAVFLMRDPVYRLQSMVRMRAHKHGKTLTPEQEVAMMRRYQGRIQDSARAQYDWTITQLDTAFGREAVFLKLYEEFFTPDIGDQLGAFFGRQFTPAPITRSSNASSIKNPDLTRETYQSFRRAYAPMIDRVGRQTGFDVDRHWRWKPEKKAAQIAAAAATDAS